MKHHVIYIPGLGDHRALGQDKIIKLWRLFGLRVHYCPVSWADGQKFTPKLEKLTHKVKSLTSQGFSVSLVGVSAGASAALNLYMHNKDKIHKVVFIAGKIKDPTNVNPRYFSRNPAFKDSLYLSDTNYKKLTAQDKQKMIYMHGLVDGTTPPKNNQVPDIRSKTILAVGHIDAIFKAITFYAPFIARYIKRA